MRIIAGSERSRPLIAPKGNGTRPTQDRVRESIFNMLAFRVDYDGLRVLDCFAGSGALALEALSRGAAAADMIDSSREAVSAMKTNVSALGYEGRAHIIAGDCARAVSELPGGYGLVFADPPYALDGSGVLEAVAARNLLVPGAIIVFEHSSRTPPTLSRRFTFLCVRSYGVAAATFFRWE